MPLAHDPITLYVDPFWSSPFDFSCFVALRAKELPFSTTIGMIREGDGVAQTLRQRAFIGLVPGLQHGDFWLTESSAIIEYLDEAFPPPTHRALLPVGAAARARARQVMAWLRAEQRALRQARPSELLFYPRAVAPLDPAAARDAADLVDVAGRLLDGADHLFGPWTIADVELAFGLSRLLAGGDALPAPLLAYVERIWQLPPVREYVLHSRPPNPPA